MKSQQPTPIKGQAPDEVGRVAYSTDLTQAASRRKQGDIINKVNPLVYLQPFKLTFMQDLFLDVLSSAATKREAKSYLSRFASRKPATQTAEVAPLVESRTGVNLGHLYPSTRAVEESPKFVHKPQAGLTQETTQPLHVALVKIRATQLIDDATLQGVGHTLSQLTRLGLSCVVVVDYTNCGGLNIQEQKRLALEHADRLVAAIDLYGGQGATRLDNMIGILPVAEQDSLLLKVRRKVQVTNRNLLLSPLRRGVIPVITAIGFSSTNQSLALVDADEVVLALTREFAGIQTRESPDEDPLRVAERVKELQKQISLDRVILLDTLGGIPSNTSAYGSHVFINLEQEFDPIREELKKSRTESSDQVVDLHLRNLELLRQTLALLPPTSSALLTTPQEAANSGKRSQQSQSSNFGVGTRTQRNALIHNLLTDKPVFSPSLPSTLSAKTSPATFVKRGMPITIIPNPFTNPWMPPTASSPSIKLTDPRIDLTRLVQLIDDSFGRKLDVNHYLSRIHRRIAGVIIAGEYEGGAILTWETPPGADPTSSVRMVPYLDKFAVLKRSQGAGGVADIVFKAMVRDCLPNGVCWRSRKDNPVNKWYFERAKGTWKMPGTNWTMFWTTEEVEQDLILDYENVCKAVEPSWADKKAVVD